MPVTMFSEGLWGPLFLVLSQRGNSPLCRRLWNSRICPHAANDSVRQMEWFKLDKGIRLPMYNTERSLFLFLSRDPLPSSDLVKMLRRTFPQQRILLTSAFWELLSNPFCLHISINVFMCKWGRDGKTATRPVNNAFPHEVYWKKKKKKNCNFYLYSCTVWTTISGINNWTSSSEKLVGLLTSTSLLFVFFFFPFLIFCFCFFRLFFNNWSTCKIMIWRFFFFALCFWKYFFFVEIVIVLSKKWERAPPPPPPLAQ